MRVSTATNIIKVTEYCSSLPSKLNLFCLYYKTILRELYRLKFRTPEIGSYRGDYMGDLATLDFSKVLPNTSEKILYPVQRNLRKSFLVGVLEPSQDRGLQQVYYWQRWR